MMARSKLVRANRRLAEQVIKGHQKVENLVVGSYRKIEDAFVDLYLTQEGESVEAAKARLRAEKKGNRVKRGY